MFRPLINRVFPGISDHLYNEMIRSSKKYALIGAIAGTSFTIVGGLAASYGFLRFGGALAGAGPDKIPSPLSLGHFTWTYVIVKEGGYKYIPLLILAPTLVGARFGVYLAWNRHIAAMRPAQASQSSNRII